MPGRHSYGVVQEIIIDFTLKITHVLGAHISNSVITLLYAHLVTTLFREQALNHVYNKSWGVSILRRMNQYDGEVVRYGCLLGFAIDKCMSTSHKSSSPSSIANSIA